MSEEATLRTFDEYAARAPRLYDELTSRPIQLIAGSAFEATPAIYVFYLEGLPVHVGRTRNLRQRLRGHVTASHFSASFAFKRARKSTGIRPTYRKGEGRGALMENPIFRAAFDHALVEVRGMSVRYLRVDDPLDRYMLELFAALQLETSLSEFEEH